MYHNTPTNYLTFFNEGLPNLNINNITSTYDFLGGGIVFCCTGGGVFYFTFGVGIDPVVEGQTKITIYPNPVKAKMQISIKSDKPVSEISSMEIYNNHGQKVDEIKYENISSIDFEIKWNKGDLPAGVYFLIIKTKKESWSEKFIIL
jgi:hypothetical protein